MEEYASNSNKSKEKKKEEKELVPEKKVDKVITGTAKTRKKNKFAEVFISEDVQSVKSYILLDVVVPATKKLISDVVTNGIDTLLYGESAKPSNKSIASKVSYRSYYDNRNNRRDDRDRPRQRNTYDYDDIVLESRGEAEHVLERLDEVVDQFGMASVADLYELVGITGKYTDNDYGWTNLRSARVERCRDGYWIRMPKALPLD